MKYLSLLSFLFTGALANRSYDQHCNCHILEEKYIINNEIWILNLVNTSHLSDKIFKLERESNSSSHKRQNYIFKYQYCNLTNRELVTCYTDKTQHYELTFSGCHRMSSRRICAYEEIQLIQNGRSIFKGKLANQ